MKDKLFIEIIGPWGVGKTTLINKIMSIENKSSLSYQFQSIPKNRKREWFGLLPLLKFSTINLDYITKIFFHSKKGYFSNNLDFLFYLFFHRYYKIKNTKKDVDRVYMCEPLFHRLIGLNILNEKINIDKTLIKTINKKHYNKNNVLIIDKHLEEEKIIKRRKNRKNRFDLFNDNELIRQTKKYNFLKDKWLKEINYDKLIQFKDDNPKKLLNKINTFSKNIDKLSR